MRALITFSSCIILLTGLPLLGVFLSGKPVAAYLEFPPLTRYVIHSPFSWPYFCVLSCIVTGSVLFFESRVHQSWKQVYVESHRSGDAFPWWGWGGIGLTTVSWILAWNRFSWFESFQVFTFSPLWFGYILVVNALTLKRSGHCMVTDRPRHLLKLFVASALFWWFFEYLNRFVQNWFYEGIGDLSSMEYVIYATLPFSTVLPAVMGTSELLKTFPRIGAGLDNYVRIDVSSSSIMPWILLSFSCAGLFGIGIWPGYLYFILWLSPVLIIVSLQIIQGRETLFSDLKHGNWKRIYIMAMSALICGLFWEMWNYYSLAKWHYSIPYVDRFRLFEMPVLGYAGYLPFGIECAVIADMLDKRPRQNTE